ncbi:GLPGLI family protein [Hymenobacter cellulosilyticus]|uniref:GLPGLI family protein n=1 Tax=Hymenobacter cellulosilyticus TaxID=2932248 RepID=A0A8T9QEB1_9BACT|nr:GLPGLI family protein [Hymenobacter cellulosilyticus]UOQ73153.1 GLPGLI family protein [Hymenobacter cellulosilyticus]
MKKLFLLLSASTLLLLTRAQAQTAGLIQFEVTQKVDPSQMRVVINGQAVKPGSPDFPADISDVRSFPMTLSFAGGFAKEERQNAAMRTVVEGGPGAAPQVTNLGRPYEEAVYVNLAENKLTTVLTIKKGEVTTSYRTDAPFSKAPGWQTTDQTKKIAGYTCRKATVPFKQETYTVWYTTELPFTYSPVKELLPEKGVVLALEGAREQYRATKVNLKAVAEAEVKPTAEAQLVTAAQLQDLREKARADFRQRLFDQEQRGN